LSTLIAYNRRIDGLRAAAVVLVILHHWLPGTSWINWTPNGQLGVDLFFVLSGYLITGILLRFRTVVESGRKSVGRALGDFYARRALRLFPLYYAVLALAALWPSQVTHVSIRSSWPWYVAFLQNSLLFTARRWDGFLSHFWSLAVEEQYYLVWGLAVLTLSRRTLLWLIGSGVAAAIALRTLGVLTSAGDVDSMSFWNILTPACFDGLGLGSLAAVAVHGDASPLLGKLKRWSWRLGVPCALFIATFRIAPPVWFAFGRTASSILALSVLFWALGDRPASWIGRFWEWKPVTELGRRSYGLYVFHNLVPFIWGTIGSIGSARLPGWPTWADIAFSGPRSRLLWPLVLVLLAFGSWRFFEGPINRLKDRFAP